LSWRGKEGKFAALFGGKGKKGEGAVVYERLPTCCRRPTGAVVCAQGGGEGKKGMLPLLPLKEKRGAPAMGTKNCLTGLSYAATAKRKGKKRKERKALLSPSRGERKEGVLVFQGGAEAVSCEVIELREGEKENVAPSL